MSGSRRIAGGARMARAGAAVLVVLVAACGGVAPPAATPDQEPSAAPSPTAGSRGSDLDDVAGRALAGFAAFLADPGRAYHVDYSALTILDGIPLATYRWSMDVTGRDFAATLTVADWVSEELAIGDLQWFRADGGAWQREARDHERHVIGLEPAACLGNIRNLVLVDASAGANALSFAFAGPIHFMPATISESGGGDVTVDARVVLTSDGSPVGIDCTMSAEVDAPAGGRQAMEETWSMAFSDVGEHVGLYQPASPPSPVPTSPAATGDPDPDLHPTLARFAARIADPGLSFHMHQAGTMRGGGLTMEIDYDVDVAGRDFAAVLRLGGQIVELRGVDGMAYVKGADGGWIGGPLSDDVAAGITDPWRYLDALEDLRKTGKANRPAGGLEFVTTRPVDYQTGAMEDAGIVGEITSLVFVVLRDGTPVSLTFTAVTPDAIGTIFEIESVVTFSDVGEPRQIAVPED